MTLLGLDGWSTRLFRGRNPPEPRPERGQLDQILEDGKYLLHYAVEVGEEVDPDVAARIIDGTLRGHAVWESPQAGELVTAMPSSARNSIP
ncbi:hypothetical protein GCM10028796_13360 [Ramlibacter monticola]